MVHRLRGLGFALLMALPATLVLATACTAQNRVSLTPSTGSPATRFTVHFRSPDRTGRVGSLRRTDVLSAGGPKRRPGCVSHVSLKLAPLRKGQRTSVPLNPKRLGGAWCPGRFAGQITESVTRVCPVSGPCASDSTPAPRRLARFSFRVKGRRPAGGTPAPTFGGLKLAVTCLGGTVNGVKGERSYRLSWDPASDPTTPRSAIVYDIFYASSPGGEDFAHPTWTTPPGVSEFTAKPARVGGGAYFVVRARDQAGHEDQNTIERAGVSNCG
jgi:hypothetical protein